LKTLYAKTFHALYNTAHLCHLLALHTVRQINKQLFGYCSHMLPLETVHISALFMATEPCSKYYLALYKCDVVIFRK